MANRTAPISLGEAVNEFLEAMTGIRSKHTIAWYRRVLASPEVTEDSKANLTAIYASLDPVALRLQIQKLQRQVWHNSRVRFLADATTPT